MAYYPAVWRARRAPVAWNDVFGRFDRVFDSNDGNRFSLAWSPVTDVREDEDGLHVTVELPGMSTDDVSVSLENGILSISGEKKQQTEQENAESNHHLVERRYGSFERTFRLPRSVDSDKVKAKFADGLLNIDIPKSEKAKKKQIEIK
ncbi:Hsp20/alpha crystallin family protein [Gemmatimonadota bacterium]